VPGETGGGFKKVPVKVPPVVPIAGAAVINIFNPLISDPVAATAPESVTVEPTLILKFTCGPNAFIVIVAPV
jgi:hypothetical protein